MVKKKTGRPEIRLEDRAIADRLRLTRQLRRFSQGELAEKAGLSLGAYRNYEYATRRMPYNAGLALCRHLELSLIWLAFGEGEERCFIDPETLEIPTGRLSGLNRRRDFLSVVREIIAEPYRQKAKEVWGNLVESIIKDGPEKFAQKASDSELHSEFLQRSAELYCALETPQVLYTSNPVVQKLASWEVLKAIVDEIGRRLEQRHRTTKGIRKKDSEDRSDE